MPEQAFRERLDERLVLYLMQNPEASGDDRRIRGFMAGARAALELACDESRWAVTFLGKTEKVVLVDGLRALADEIGGAT